MPPAGESPHRFEASSAANDPRPSPCGGGAGAERAPPGARAGPWLLLVDAPRRAQRAVRACRAAPLVVDGECGCGCGALRAAGVHPTVLSPRQATVSEGGVPRLAPPRRMVLPCPATAGRSTRRNLCQGLAEPPDTPSLARRRGPDRFSRELERAADSADCRPRAHSERPGLKERSHDDDYRPDRSGPDDCTGARGTAPDRSGLQEPLVTLAAIVAAATGVAGLIRGASRSPR